MDTFIKKNEKFLKISFVALRFSGWFLLVFGLCSPVVSIVLLSKYEPGIDGQTSITWFLLVGLSLVSLGLLGIGLSQLIRYLLDSNYRPGLVLRHGDKFIYAYVLLTLIAATQHILFILQYLRMPDYPSRLIILNNSVLLTVYCVAKASIFIGIAQFLKRLMPIIDEHKSLI